MSAIALATADGEAPRSLRLAYAAPVPDIRMNELRISYQPDDPGMGEITVRVSAGAFAGETKAWIAESQISDFAESLSGHPISKDQPATLQVRYGARQGQPTPPPLIKISIGPLGQLGRVLVLTELRRRSLEQRGFGPV
jgi:hypothetical protein